MCPVGRCKEKNGGSLFWRQESRLFLQCIDRTSYRRPHGKLLFLLICWFYLSIFIQSHWINNQEIDLSIKERRYVNDIKRSGKKYDYHHSTSWSGLKQHECSSVTLCRWSTKQTIPLSVLVRNQTKAWARDLDVTGSRLWNAKSWKKELRGGSWRRMARVASRHRTAERPVGMR